VKAETQVTKFVPHTKEAKPHRMVDLKVSGILKVDA